MPGRIDRWVAEHYARFLKRWPDLERDEFEEALLEILEEHADAGKIKVLELLEHTLEKRMG